jgi:hypothetical protein
VVRRSCTSICIIICPFTTEIYLNISLCPLQTFLMKMLDSLHGNIPALGTGTGLSNTMVFPSVSLHGLCILHEGKGKLVQRYRGKSRNRVICIGFGVWVAYTKCTFIDFLIRIGTLSFEALACTVSNDITNQTNRTPIHSEKIIFTII